MKSAIAASILALSASVALAQSAPTNARVPTGIDVKGSTDYKLDGTRVVQQASGCTVAAVSQGKCNTSNSEKTPAADQAGGGAPGKL